MSRRKIIGVTVGTPTSPSKMEKEIKPVKSVNDVAPDENGNVKIGMQEAVNEALRIAKESGEFDGAPGEKGDKGDPGENGKDGYTPVKGVDYFDGKNGIDGKDGQNGKDGYTPIKGKDYFDGKDGSDGVDGKDGAPGAPGESGVYVGSGTPPAGTRVQVDPNGEAYTVGDLLQMVIDQLPKYNGEVEDA